MSRSYRGNIKFDVTSSSLAIEDADGETIHFLVTTDKQPNYMEYCNKASTPENPTEIIRTYTEHTNKIYEDINLALAADNAELKKHGKYIEDLRSSILSKPFLDDTTLFRGVELSDTEINHMEKLGRFFIPSFTSTSVERSKAYVKSALLIIDTCFCSRYACSVTSDLSNYYTEEKEVLLACYSAFRLQRIEKVNNRTFVSLFLDEFNSSLDRM